MKNNVIPIAVRRLEEDPEAEVKLSELKGLDVTLRCEAFEGKRYYIMTARLPCAAITVRDQNFSKAIRELRKLCKGRVGCLPTTNLRKS